ncbi:MAG: Uma2 family endonuclease [Streptosporangiales bacterium]
MTALPHEPEWTVDDLDALPDDGLQYELLDGLLLVTPVPIPIHQGVIGNLYLVLRDACPAGLTVFLAPLDWRPDLRTSLQPDLLVVRRDEIGEKNVTYPELALAVEVLSPSTRRKDLVLKRSKYEDAGVGSYWVVDPKEPSVQAWDLVDGRYVETGVARGAEPVTLDRPFPVTLIPADLAQL